ncbi:MAG: hypothetical protein J6K96_10265 [Treponema sp.]|nr:hypothetical protein [Treponema sp.]
MPDTDRAFGAPNALLLNAVKEFFEPNAHFLDDGKEFCMQNVSAASASKEFAAPHSFLSDAAGAFLPRAAGEKICMFCLENKNAPRPAGRNAL